ncbi:7-carboxy-7-deazaguanine synthase [Lignipirellula cremea]|uniref:7-carboxy-7-deazaguanine synthase n=1 Tax=Lignipirellula cremea TaxID=2528010 RepID=A0A518E1U8_9BACT|nr:7-carboxy-7-deazaguanine synthase [Lignipirellula cremea]QDU98042.1 7-carboxy-7-deazaguanine synthase [Lignipirellula cremea]
MAYSVKEIYFTLQGEGAQTGRPAVFCRLTGCNLWTGREADRARAVCGFCDTDFVGIDGPGGGRFETAANLAEAVLQHWPQDHAERPFVVLTGGEPLLQADAALLEALHHAGLEVALETNGTLPLPAAFDWVCVSPKAGARLAITQGDELKLVYPQANLDPADFVGLDFRHFYLQPLDSPTAEQNTEQAMEYCRRHPHWRLSLQTHKILGIR